MVPGADRAGRLRTGRGCSRVRTGSGQPPRLAAAEAIDEAKVVTWV